MTCKRCAAPVTPDRIIVVAYIDGRFCSVDCRDTFIQERWAAPDATAGEGQG